VFMLRVAVCVVALAAAVGVGAQETVSPSPTAAESRSGAEETTPANLVVRNVYLIGRHDVANDVLVSIVILDGVLQVVTRDEVPPGIAELTVDAGGGFLFGKLDLGSPSS